MNTQPHIAYIFDRRKISSLSKKASIEMRITYNYKQKYISTGILLYSNQWKNGKIINTPDAMILHQLLDKMLMDVRQIIMEMYKECNITLDLIPIKLKQLHTSKINFIDFCKQRASIRKYGKSADSRERYDRFIRLFTKWGKIQNFEDINERNIIQYDKYLIKEGMKPYSKWNNYHRFLNSFILDAIDAGYIKRNPYKWINIEKEKSITGIGKYLSPDEFKMLKTAKMPTISLEHVRDVFIFQTYTCLSYSDLKEFDATLIEKVKDMSVYTGKRKKTNVSFTIPLLPHALEILKKYNNKLPVISNEKYNEYLKVVAQSAKIDKPISSHWARHTGATLLLNEGIEMKIISKICGHSSTKITEQIYAKLLDETVIDAVQELKI